MDVRALMDVALWSFLPTVLVELVLAKLPFMSLIRMRLVCKSWNLFILSESLSPLNPNPKSKLLHTSSIYEDSLSVYEAVKFFNDGAKHQLTLIAYDTLKGGWQKLFIDWPREVLNKHVWLPVPMLVATGGGLLCFDVSYSTDQYFVVSNPITKKWKKLPCMELHPRLSSGTSIWWRVAGLAYDENCRSYKVVVIGFCGCQEGQGWFLKGTQVYDSVTESWTFTFQEKEFTGGSEWLMKASNKSLFFNNHLYVADRMNFGRRHGVAIFSMKKGTWIQLPSIDFIKNEGPACLVLHEDHVVLVAEGMRSWNTLSLWKLNIPKMEVMWNPSQPYTGNLWLKQRCGEFQDLWLPQYYLPGIAPYMRNLMAISNWTCVAHRNFTSLVFYGDMNQGAGPVVHAVLPHYVDERYHYSTKHFKVENPCNSYAFEPSLSALV